MAVSALFYYHLEKVMGRYYSSTIAKVLAWIHLSLMNIGTTPAMGLLMYAGYVWGAATLPKIVGGSGFNPVQTHEHRGPFVAPISAAILVLVAGVLAGGIGIIIIKSLNWIPRLL
jgi:heme/copper-type cytochrome/quinol oxidase subunit 1